MSEVAEVVAPAPVQARSLLHGPGLLLTREFRIEDKSVDEAKRTAVVAFSSEFPVLRSDFSGRQFFEVLDQGSTDMSRMVDAPLLFNHREHIGIVDSSAIGPDKKGRAIVRFSRSPLGEQKLQDVKDRILTKTSVGYDLSNADCVADGERDGIPIYRFRGWQPYEVTLTPLPADPSVGLGRSAHAQPPEIPADSPKANHPEQVPQSRDASKGQPVIQSRSKMSAAPAASPEAPPAPTPNLQVLSESDVRNAATAARSTELTRIKDINAAAKSLADRHPDKADVLRQLASKCAETGDDIAVFNRTVLNDILGTEQKLAPVRQDPNAARLGLNGKDRKRFSLMRAIQRSMNNEPLDGLEGECNVELTRRLERQPKGFFIPDEILADRRNLQLSGQQSRTLAAGSPVDGGYTVGVEDLVGEFVTYLRNNAVVMKAGARTIAGLVGDITIPRQLTGASAYWVSETGSITQSGATYGQIVGRPRRIGTSVPYSKQFLAQSSLSVESEVVNDSDASIALDLDRVALRGLGGAEPLGIANLNAADRSTAVHFGAAPTWPKYLEFFSSVGGNNSLTGSPAYVASIASAVKAMSTAKFANTGIPIWDNDKVGVFNAFWTTQLLTSATPVANMVIFGDFSQVLFLEWAGRDVVIDPYAGKKEGTIEVTIQRLMDVVIKRSKSFSISDDSGAQ